MQLLLRGAALLDPDDPVAETVLAASPDSLARARWLWDVRVARTLEPAYAAASTGIGPHRLVVRTADDVEAQRSRVELDSPSALRRPPHELWLVVVTSGALRHGAFTVAAGDVLVWEGDDPTSIELEPASDDVVLEQVRLRRSDGSELRWVP
jgi:hypothetical protein